MPIDAEKVRVLIPTTNGLVEVLLLTPEDPAIGRCVACIGGTTDVADIAAAYHAFVVRPTGVIERLFGHSCFRLDVSDRIDAGSSWQLGVLAAHALHAAGRLAEENGEAQGVIWATGSVRPVDLTVGGVSHIEEKLASSLDRLKQEASAGRRVLVAIPSQNAETLNAAGGTDLAAHGIEVAALADAPSLWSCLAVTPPDPSSAAVRPTGERPVLAPPARRGRKRAAALAAMIVASVGLGLVALFPLMRSPAPLADLGDPPQAQLASLPSQASAPPPAVQKEAEVLVPETVPFVSDRGRGTIRTVYLPAPDFKALALSSHTMGMVTDQPDEATARSAAMAACQRAMEEQRVNSRCELYAVGARLVSSRGRPPLPLPPWVTRNPAVETPFAVKDIPLISDATRKALEGYGRYRKSKAIAISSTGIYNEYSQQSSTDEAVRRALERCGSNSGTACIIVAIDDVFVVPIPRSLRVTGILQAGALTAVAPERRDDVARRLGNATNGWSAVAVGASGNVGVKTGADAEETAIESAMADCNMLDRMCRIVAIGPFLIEGAAGSKPSDEAKLSELIATMKLASPMMFAGPRDDAAQKYQAAKGHKALAFVPGTGRFWRSTEWPTPEGAGEGVLEGCQIHHGLPCSLVAIDDKLQAMPVDGTSARDMARVRYAGRFDPARLPNARPNVRERPDIVGYLGASGPKAAAYHPWGRVFTVVAAETQRAAETRALSDCNLDPMREGQDGPCHLYAIGDNVVLPQRFIAPSSP